jgi:hypothetical protein
LIRLVGGHFRCGHYVVVTFKPVYSGQVENDTDLEEVVQIHKIGMDDVHLTLDIASHFSLEYGSKLIGLMKLRARYNMISNYGMVM